MQITSQYVGFITFRNGILNVALIANYGRNSSLGNRTSDSEPGNVGLLFQSGILHDSHGVLKVKIIL
jgi:hypothetical protein